MFRSHPARVHVRNGLSLIELLVVLVVLVALAGVIIPLLPSFIGRAHTSTGATNTGEVTKAIQMFEATYSQYPDQFDSLLGTGGTAFFQKLPGGTTGGLTTGANASLAVSALDAGGLAALTNAGITQVWDLSDTTTEPTFNPYGAIRTLAASGNVVTLTDAGKTALGLKLNQNYAVFGVGRKNTAIGKVITDPPVHFADNAQDNPANAYGRVAVIFQLTRDNTTTPISYLDRAKLVGATSLHSDTVSGTDDHLREYYNIVGDTAN
jgi:prepilin-type N-terminal cleavage/methylation domain-containing protein